jgi:hypothetical protein
MKKILTALSVFAVLSLNVANAEIHPELFKVVEVSAKYDVTVLASYDGSQWVYEGAEDWQAGDFAVGIVEDYDNADAYDDELLTLRYCTMWDNSMN